jgi:hypothetical protein
MGLPLYCGTYIHGVNEVGRAAHEPAIAVDGTEVIFDHKTLTRFIRKEVLTMSMYKIHELHSADWPKASQVRSRSQRDHKPSLHHSNPTAVLTTHSGTISLWSTLRRPLHILRVEESPLSGRRRRVRIRRW